MHTEDLDRKMGYGLNGAKLRAKKATFILYCLFIVWYTVLSRTPKEIHSVELRLFWSYRELIAGKPTAKANVIQNIKNIIFFIPFGFFIPVKHWKFVLVISIVFSVCIEVVQYVGGYGLAELDDVICNSLGALIGFVAQYWLLRLLVRNSDET